MGKLIVSILWGALLVAGGNGEVIYGKPGGLMELVEPPTSIVTPAVSPIMEAEDNNELLKVSETAYGPYGAHSFEGPGQDGGDLAVVVTGGYKVADTPVPGAHLDGPIIQQGPEARGLNLGSSLVGNALGSLGGLLGGPVGGTLGNPTGSYGGRGVSVGYGGPVSYSPAGGHGGHIGHGHGGHIPQGHGVPFGHGYGHSGAPISHGPVSHLIGNAPGHGHGHGYSGIHHQQPHHLSHGSPIHHDSLKHGAQGHPVGSFASYGLPGLYNRVRGYGQHVPSHGILGHPRVHGHGHGHQPAYHPLGHSHGGFKPLIGHGFGPINLGHHQHHAPPSHGYGPAISQGGPVGHGGPGGPGGPEGPEGFDFGGPDSGISHSPVGNGIELGPQDGHHGYRAQAEAHQNIVHGIGVSAASSGYAVPSPAPSYGGLGGGGGLFGGRGLFG